MKVVVLGGGTIGYLTALIFKKKYPEVEVKIIASSSIGVVGPGEGLTPSINKSLSYLGISLSEFLSASNGTIKNGIKYTNWGVKNKSFFHSFYDPILDEQEVFDDPSQFFELTKVAASLNKNLDEINLQASLSEEGKVMLENAEDFAFHIDATKIIPFLENLAIKDGIEIIDSVVKDINTGPNGDILSLSLENSRTVPLDFVFDCSGFRRLLIGNHYKQKWISASKHLPANSAIACRLPIDKDPAPYTEARAMDYGWSWKIPLQDRYGCGYVFNDSYISFEKAEEEMISVFGKDLEVVHRINFESGFFENVLVNNCLALGLSNSFFEPIEATSIDGSLSLLYKFLNEVSAPYIIRYGRPQLAKMFNDYFRKRQFFTLSFIYLHYQTKKTNTVFWKDAVEKYPIPNYPEYDTERLVGTLGKNDPSDYDSELSRWLQIWKLQSWMAINHGNELVDTEDGVSETQILNYKKVINRIKSKSKKFLLHSHYLEESKKINKAL
jgi:tryptophan halogenase